MMHTPDAKADTRKRSWLKKGAALTGVSLLGGLSNTLAISAQQSNVPLTPECGVGASPTISQAAGPFYTPNSPLRNDLKTLDIEGQALNLMGRVLNQNCEPIRGAILDFWHADSEGIYDNQGFRLRGHLFTGDAGEFALASILPGIYPGRTRHIHVIVQGPKTHSLTTQLYFKGEPLNARDFGYDPRLEMASNTAKAHYQFDFILKEIT